MNLISCDNCGVVLDGNKLKFPSILINPDGSYSEKFSAYDHDSGTFYAKVPCPVCGADTVNKSTQP
jgi:hypothetical protein